MNYKLVRDGQELGQFNEEQIRAGLFDGTYQQTDLVWAEGLADLKPLSEVFAQRLVAPPALPVNTGTPPPLAAKKSNGCMIAAIIVAVLFVGITVIAILAALALPAYSAVQEKGNITKEINNARQLVVACKIYANDHNGSYPKTLNELVPAGELTQENFDKLISFKIPSWRGEPGFDYFGSCMKDSDSADQVLLQSKAVSRLGQRVEAHNDGTAMKTKGDKLTPR